MTDNIFKNESAVRFGKLKITVQRNGQNFEKIGMKGFVGSLIPNFPSSN